MPRYHVSIVSRFDSNYEVDASSKEDAIEKAKAIFEFQTWDQRVDHIVDGAWLSEYAEEFPVSLIKENDHA